MKKNLRQIPADILAKVKLIKGNEIAVGCALKIKAEALAAGGFKHLGIELGPSGVTFPPTVVPPSEQGKFSKWNVEGKEIVRKDLPKETHYNSVDVPNWGDSYNGTHTVDLPYKKYPRDFYPPRELEISIHCHDSRPGLPVYILAFKVQETLDIKAKSFEVRLFENLNLLQENVGACGVEAADLAMKEFLKTLHVSWEILPPGTVDQTIERLFRGRAPSQKEQDVAAERYNFFMKLKSKSLVFGNSGFRRYFGALLETNLVVFENIQYGNAIYVMFENWEDLSIRSRVDLLAGKFGTAFERVAHKPGWKGNVEKIVREKRSRNDK
jgi:hypothetical protein